MQRTDNALVAPLLLPAELCPKQNNNLNFGFERPQQLESVCGEGDDVNER